MELVQIFSLLGAFIQLVAFYYLQRGLIDTDNIFYQYANLIGSSVMFCVSLQLNSWGFALMEGSWAAVSLYGLIKYYKRHKTISV
jgi:hypothetical protein